MDHFARITDAFRALRTEGIIARQNFKCCMGCGSAAICSDIEAMPDAKRAAVTGAVYYSHQDRTGAENRRGEFSGLYISFGAVPGAADGSTAKIGERLATALRSNGLTVEWDGSVGTRDLVAP